MIKKFRIQFIFHLLVISGILSACAAFPVINDEETIDVPLGPQISLTEQQTLVFEETWKNIENYYIYYKTSATNWNTLQEKYLNQIAKGLTAEEFDALMQGFETEFPAEELIYISREERIQTDISDNSVYGGIGAYVGFQAEDIPHVVILDVMPGSPAERMGLKAHDSIFAVAGEAVIEEEGLDVVNRIRGVAGTTVELTIQSPGESKRDVTITRAQLSGIGEIKTKEISDGNIGYVLVPTTVSGNFIDELLLAFKDFSANENLKGIVLDLRIANGTTNWQLENMLTAFTDGTIGTIYNREESNLLNIDGQDISGSQNIPLVVLVGEHTGGFPVIFAASIQSSGRGVTMGAVTRDNIESTNGFPLSNGAQVFIAGTSFRVGDNNNIGLDGFTPEILVDAEWDEITPKTDPVIEAAIEFLNEVKE